MAISELWQELSLVRKTYIVALVFAFASPFLPWFTDATSFGNGSVHLGLAGPTAYMGVAIFMVALVASFQELFFVLKQKHILGDGFANFIYKGAGPFMLYNLLMAGAVFMSPEVGSSALSKDFSWGFYFSLAAYIGINCGIFLKTKEKAAKISNPKMETYENQRTARPIKPNTINLQNHNADLGNLKVGDLAKVSDKTIYTRRQWEHQKDIEDKISTNDQEKYF